MTLITRKKRFGGEVRDLNNKSSIPISIRLILDNPYLDSMVILQVLSEFKNKRSGLEFKEIEYYFTLVNSLIEKEQGYIIDYLYIQNRYLDIQKNIKDRLIELGNQDLIRFNTKNNGGAVEVKVLATDKAIRIANEVQSDFLIEMREKVKYIKEKYQLDAFNKSIVWRNY